MEASAPRSHVSGTSNFNASRLVILSAVCRGRHVHTSTLHVHETGFQRAATILHIDTERSRRLPIYAALEAQHKVRLVQNDGVVIALNITIF